MISNIKQRIKLLLLRSLQVYIGALMSLGKTDVDDLIDEVIDGRQTILGKNHPYTIDAVMMKAVCISKRGQLESVNL